MNKIYAKTVTKPVKSMVNRTQVKINKNTLLSIGKNKDKANKINTCSKSRRSSIITMYKK